MIVVDVNVIAYLMIDSPYTGEVQALYQRDPLWMVPDLWRHEFANVLRTNAAALDWSKDKATTILKQALEIFGRVTRPVPLEASLRLAIANGLSAYDAEYAYLAQSLDLPLVTYDRALLRKCPDLARTAAAHLKQLNA
jgi:predicted nucleic acid-binding protein